MSSQSRPNRPGATLVAGLVTLPLVAAFAVGQEQAGKTAPEGRQADVGKVAVLRGRVTDEAGAPLAGVRVRAAVPAIDMRFVDADAKDKLVEARSDAKGDYRMELPGVTKRTTVSVDAMKPGYRRLVGKLMAGGDARRVEVEPGAEAEAALELKPALYFRGTVFDEQGRPVPGVRIAANANTLRSSGAIERTTSNADGSFELFNYPVEPNAFGNEARKGAVHFSHPDYLALTLDDVYALEPNQREALRLVLESGHKVAGTVLDDAGKPVPGATVKAVLDDGSHRKAALTGADGRFALRGLGGGQTVLTARALGIKQKARVEMALGGDKDDLEVRLRTIALPADLKTHDVLGMRLADVTPELKSAYDLYWDRAALILDPGKDSDRLNVGKLAEGYVFWMVGNTRVGGVREFVNQILAETAGRVADEYSVRVVYTFSTVDFDGTNTQYLKLTKDDLKQLQAVSDRLKTGPQ